MFITRPTREQQKDCPTREGELTARQDRDLPDKGTVPQGSSISAGNYVNKARAGLAKSLARHGIPRV